MSKTIFLKSFQEIDMEITELDASSKQSEQATEVKLDSDSIELIAVLTEPIASIETESNEEQEKSESQTLSQSSSNNDETVEIIDDSSDEAPLVSPPRKSARLSAKRRDSITDSEISVTSKCESPVPRRRSMRLGSTSSVDTPPRKPKDETVIKKLPTIVEAEKPATEEAQSTKVDDETRKSEKDLVDEMAAAFVGEFIDIDD